MVYLDMRKICSKMLFLAAFALSGCVSPPVAEAPLVDPMAASLDQAIFKKSAQKPVGPEVAPMLPKYGERVTVSFMGDASTLLGDVAKGRGGAWTFGVSGPQPRLPIYIQVSVKDAAFVDFLSGVAEQLGQRADIALNGSAIELVYRAQN